MVANQPWLTINALSIPVPQIHLPKNKKKLFPKFDPDDDTLPKEHINKFMLSMNIMNAQHEDVACRLVYFTFQGMASSWFFNLALRSMPSWK